jgi:hypothetical protein
MATWQLGAHLGSRDPEHVSRWLNAMWAGRRAAPKCEGDTKTGARCCGQRLYGSIRCIHHTRGAERDRVDMARLERQRRFAHSNCASERASALRQIRNIERRLLHRYWKINPEAEGSTLELSSSDELKARQYLRSGFGLDIEAVDGVTGKPLTPRAVDRARWAAYLGMTARCADEAARRRVASLLRDERQYWARNPSL